MITNDMIDAYNAKHDDKILTLFAIENVELLERILESGKPMTEREAVALDCMRESDTPGGDALVY